MRSGEWKFPAFLTRAANLRVGIGAILYNRRLLREVLPKFKVDLVGD